MKSDEIRTIFTICTLSQETYFSILKAEESLPFFTIYMLGQKTDFGLLENDHVIGK